LGDSDENSIIAQKVEDFHSFKLLMNYEENLPGGLKMDDSIQNLPWKYTVRKFIKLEQWMI
jgi:hypothetical protein